MTVHADYRLTQLDELEAESIHIFREVASEFEKPVLMFSGGKDSIVMLRLAEKAFFPAKIPFPVLQVDTGFDFPGGHSVALPHAVVVLVQLGTFLAKILAVCSFQILVRWSLPRFRYDQLLRFAWKFMFPLALANLCVTVAVLWLMERA